MNPTSYQIIEQIINEANKRDHDTMVSVPVGDLRDLFKLVRHLLRRQGTLGFTEQGNPIVNDIGMIAIVKSIAKNEFGHLGNMISCNISRKAGELIWVAEMVFPGPDGTSITITQNYRLSYLADKFKFEYELP